MNVLKDTLDSTVGDTLSELLLSVSEFKGKARTAICSRIQKRFNEAPPEEIDLAAQSEMMTPYIDMGLKAIAVLGPYATKNEIYDYVVITNNGLPHSQGGKRQFLFWALSILKGQGKFQGRRRKRRKSIDTAHLIGGSLSSHHDVISQVSDHLIAKADRAASQAMHPDTYRPAHALILHDLAEVMRSDKGFDDWDFGPKSAKRFFQRLRALEEGKGGFAV